MDQSEQKRKRKNFTYVKYIQKDSLHTRGMSGTKFTGILNQIAANCDVSIAKLAKVVHERGSHETGADE